MAGTSLGAPALDLVSSNDAPTRTLHRVPSSSRTRRNHGVFLIGDQVAFVFSSRRGLQGLGVMLSIGDKSLQLNGSMTPTQARSMARALNAAAEASEAAGGVQ